MTDRSKIKALLSGLSPWVLLGAVGVMLPIVVAMALTNINHNKQQSIRLMMEKGGALIRSFEAGTRMGMRGGHGSGFELQRLLIETAAQPDIAYLLVTRTDGTIIAHSQIDLVGKTYDHVSDLGPVLSSGEMAWRRTTFPDGESVFEVYRYFKPLERRSRHPKHGQGMRMHPVERDPTPMVIFVGFRTDAIDAAHRNDMRHTTVLAVVLLLVGCAGVLLLFLTHNYRLARTSLSRQKAFSDDLVSRMPMGLVALDRYGAVSALNAVAEATLGIRADNAVGRPYTEVIPPSLTEILTHADTLVEKEVQCTVKDGVTIPLDVSAATLTDENNEGFGRVLLFKDLSEIRSLHEELEKTRRLASVGQLAAGVAHEIRNPLSSIKGFATYFKEKYPDREKDRQVATIMIQEVDRLNRVVGQLLDFSRPIRLHRRVVPLSSFFRDALQLVAGQCERAGVTTKLDLADADLTMAMDTDKMSQVMLNLFLNALDAMPEGGRLSVRVDQNEKGEIRVTVADTGTGIGAGDLPHLFDPYFSTKQAGTGLGLAIVHNIVKAHGGRIRVESRLGEGTRFEMIMPTA